MEGCIVSLSFECSDLSCVIAGETVLSGVSLRVSSNEFLSIRGHNAAGKTTLLNAISGLVPAMGTVRINDQAISHLSSVNRARQGVIRSFENDGTFDRMSAIHNVAVGLSHSSMSNRLKRARLWLDRVDLTDHSQPGSALSLGQKRRVDLARILARVEEFDGRCVVLLDEPFRGLDSVGRKQLAELFREHLRGRVPTLMVEHNIEMSEQLATRTVWMAHGAFIDGKQCETSEVDVLSPTTRSAGDEICLKLDGVRAGYNGHEVLHGVDVEIRSGEVVRLFGGNGSGKSTLLRVIMGTLPLMSGAVSIFGRTLPDANSRCKLGVGYAPQGGRLIGQLTVDAHLCQASEIAKASGRDPEIGARFLEAFPEVEAIRKRRASDLSSGQKSLVSFAAALSTEPTLLIADEPMAGLASEIARRVCGFVEDCWISPIRTALIVEHEHLNFPARTVRLARGRVLD
jgi:branched-chain amino acid transport system ATP-binding protein